MRITMRAVPSLRAASLLAGALLAAAVLPPGAGAQVLDTLKTKPDSTDYAVETYFVKAGAEPFFRPHGSAEKVNRLIEQTGEGQCRTLTVVRAVDQRRAAELARRYDGEVLNVRLLIRCSGDPGLQKTTLPRIQPWLPRGADYFQQEVSLCLRHAGRRRVTNPSVARVFGGAARRGNP